MGCDQLLRATVTSLVWWTVTWDCQLNTSFLLFVALDQGVLSQQQNPKPVQWSWITFVCGYREMSLIIHQCKKIDSLNLGMLVESYLVSGLEIDCPKLSWHWRSWWEVRYSDVSWHFSLSTFNMASLLFMLTTWLYYLAERFFSTHFYLWFLVTLMFSLFGNFSSIIPWTRFSMSVIFISVSCPVHGPGLIITLQSSGHRGHTSSALFFFTEVWIGIFPTVSSTPDCASSPWSSTLVTRLSTLLIWFIHF